MASVNVGLLDSVVCDLCGSTTTRPVVTRPDGLQAVECVQCGLCYLNPRPRREWIENLYDGEYFSKEPSNCSSRRYGFSDYLGSGNQSLLRHAAEARLRLASPYVDVHRKSCLEVGSATGEFCELLRSQHASVVGIDLAADAISLAKLRYPQVDFRQGDLSVLRNGEMFEAIFAFEVIEHVESPLAFLTELARHLKGGGQLVLTTPNYNCGKRVGVDRWGGFQSSLEHLYFLDSQSMSRYATELGFTVETRLTGCGDGIEPEPTADRKEQLRNALRRLGILNFVRRHRPSAKQTAEVKYSDQDDLHNLFMVLTKM